ncbi:uncharacterized protein LOC112553442 [Pomacea canaliculata]|uniref:uncharacterized protein LOC112553442 n=1 Tax=Pomacea canaliculata TaxID=400727 RepID=UPI000D73B805|nr:uncharacterized protein LOC112553442 [Pomacea canaliculata]
MNKTKTARTTITTAKVASSTVQHVTARSRVAVRWRRSRTAPVLLCWSPSLSSKGILKVSWRSRGRWTSASSLWTKEGCVSQNLHRRNEERELVGENGKKGFSKPRSGVANGDRAAERICELGSFTADYVDGKRDCAETGTCSRQDDNGSRRRRKGRPSRRAKTDPRWLSEASLSPREDEGQRTGNVYRDKASLQLLASRDRPSKDQTARKSTGKRQGEASNGSGRRNRKVVDLESLWANPELDTHAFLLWASENRHGMQKRHPDASSGEVEHLLASEWTEVTFSGKVHFLCRARDAGTDQDKHAFRKKKAPFEKKNASDPEGNSVYEQFLILPLERQRELLRKWMKFFQKMLPRLEYQEFINDFKKACKSLQLRPVSARRKNARLRNLDPTHYKMLFEKIREARPRVISIYNKRKAREDTVLWQSFHALVRRLVLGQSWPFLRGCRSKVLGELLKDIQQLEVEEALAQIDPPFSLTASEVHDVLGQTPTGPSTPSPAASAPLPGGNDLFDDVRMLPTSGPETEGSSMVPREATPVSGAGHYSPVRSFIQAPGSSREPSGPAGDAELPDNAFVLGLLDGLQHAADLPVLDQRSLDTVFLGPPPRVRMTVHTRDTQLQHSAAYRRTLLYKHIQPLVDTHSLSHALPSLYHGHPPRFFFQEDR